MKEIRLESQRLVMRLIHASDLDAIHELHSLWETDRYNTLGIPENKEETKRVISRWKMFGPDKRLKNVIFVIELKAIE